MMLCDKMKATQLPSFLKLANESYIAETKEDGDRVQMRVDDSDISLITRSGKDTTFRYPEMKGQLTGNFLLDGEICVMNEDGVSEFNDGIAHRSHVKDPEKIKEYSEKYPATFMVFDVLEYEGVDIRGKPYKDRRALLEEISPRFKGKPLKLVEKSDNPQELWDKVVAAGGEGIILKHKDSRYRDNHRSKQWIKVKYLEDTDLVFTQVSEHNKGIRVETDEGIAITVNDMIKAQIIKRQITEMGRCEITVTSMGKTQSGKLRQPVFKKIVEVKQDGIRKEQG